MYYDFYKSPYFLPFFIKKNPLTNITFKKTQNKTQLLIAYRIFLVTKYEEITSGRSPAGVFLLWIITPNKHCSSPNMKRDYCRNYILNFLETIVYLCFY